MIAGPGKTVNDGLVACLDIGNNKSFKGEPTTNLFVNPTFFGDTTLGGSFTFYGGSVVYSIASGSGEYYLTPLSQRFVGPAEGATFRNSGIRFTLGGLTSGSAYTLSYYGKNLEDHLAISYFFANFSGGSTTQYQLSGGWTKNVVVTYATSTSGTVYIRPNGNNVNYGFDSLINAPQFEQKDHPTSFLDGTRDTIYDLSGNGNNATLPTSSIYESGSDLLLNGTGSATIVPSSTLNNTQFTISGWVKHTETISSGASERYLLYYNGANGGLRYGYLFGFSSNVVSNTGKLDLVIGDGGWHAYSSNKNSWLADTWYYIAATHNGTNYSLYVNGVLDKTSTAVTPTFTTMVNPTRGLGNKIVGYIGSTKIYNKALSADEISKNYYREKGRYGL